MNRKTTPSSPPPVADRGQASTPAQPTGHYGPGYGDPTPVDPSREPEPRPQTGEGRASTDADRPKENKGSAKK